MDYDARSDQHRPPLRRGAGAARHFAQSRAGQGHLRARPQRRRQDQPAARADRPASGAAAARSRFEGNDITRLSTVERARRGIAYVPQGREIFPLLTVEENLRDRFCAAAARQARHSRRRVLAVSGAQQHAAAARRRPVRRPAAAIGDRPRAGDAAAASAARRADRRHPALDHQGHRPRHRLSAQLEARWRSSWSSSISTSRRSWATIWW